jgi:serine/threonine-protein kinase
MDAERSEARLLELAGSVASGTPVDWDNVEAADAAEAALLRSLRVIDQVAQVQTRVATDAETDSAGQNERHRDTHPEHWRHLTILEHVGHGAFGDVYRARDTLLDRLVALKLLSTADAPDTARVSQLLNEARLLARLRHPNVVRVYGAESTEGRVGIWMEFIEGRTLEDLLASHVTFGDKEAAQIGQQLCRAMAAVHGVGLVHRDIKARNVMREDGGRIVLMDFGAGTDLRRKDHGARHTLAGTPLYLAPEFFDGGQPTVSADIYSLGVLLFHLVTGFYPVESQTRAGVQRAHQRRERKYLQDMRPDLPEAFIRVVERAIEHDPNDRYRTAGEFESALARLSAPAQDAVVPAPPPRINAVSAHVWKRAALASVSVAIAMVAVGAILWSRIDSRATGRTPSATVAVRTPAAVPAPSAVPDVQYIAGFHAYRDGQSAPLRQGARVSPGDRLFLEFESSKPVFLYVVNQDEDGESYLLFPLPVGPTNPLPQGQSHRLPGRRGENLYWQVSSVGVREHFYVFATAERPVAFENLLTALPAPELGKPVISRRLPADALGVLRAVGGLAAGDAPPQPNAGFRPRFPQLPMLTEGPETASGLWEREITFENPAR